MWLTKVPYCILPNNGKQLQAFPYEISLIQTLISEVGGECVTIVSQWPLKNCLY